MTKHDIWRIAREQSAEDMGCIPADFLSEENVVVPFRLGAGARKYLKEPISCTLASYGSNVVAAAREEVADVVAAYIRRYPFYHCFETPHLHWLNERLTERGHKVCFMAPYYLPDIQRLPDLACPYETRLLTQGDFGDLYKPQWSNALCEKRKELDVLGIGAYHKGELIGLAACSADCETMWQIGVDVLPAYRRQGIAAALTSRLAREILARGKVPFYCSAWSNLRSMGNAVKSGFVPAWVELSAKPAEVVDALNEVE